MQIAICEDEALVANQLIDDLEDLGHTVLFKSADYLSFLSNLNNKVPDLALLDIHLGDNEGEGIDIGAELCEREIPFFYISAYTDSETLKEAVKTNPLGYIVKPFTLNQLRAQLELAKEAIDKSHQKIHLKTGTTITKIDLEKLTYLEASKNYIIFHMDGETPIKVRSVLKEIADQLPANFIYTHRSYLLNANYLLQLKSDACVLKNGSLIPASKSYYDKLESLLNH